MVSVKIKTLTYQCIGICLLKYNLILTDFHYFTGLLYDDEEVLMNNQYIPFSHAVFNLFDDWLPSANTTTNRNTDKVQVMLMGRVILTNHRLILISAEQQEGLLFAVYFH